MVMGIVDAFRSFYLSIFYRVLNPDLSIWWQLIESGELYKKTEHPSAAKSFLDQLWLPYEFWQTLDAFSKLADKIVDYELFRVYASSTSTKILVLPEKNIKRKLTKNFTNVGILAIHLASSNNFFVRLSVFKYFLQQKVLFLIEKSKGGWFLIAKTRQIKPILIKKNTVLSPTLLATKGFIVYTAQESFRPFNKIIIEQRC